MLIISLPKLGRKLHYPHTKPNIIWLLGKTQRKPKFQKSHYDVANFKSSTMMWQIHSPLRCGTIYKNCYNAALFTKSVATRHLKARCYTTILYKISKSFLQSPNSYLASIFTKPKFLFGIYFHKAQILIWHYFTKPKYQFGTILQSPNTNLALFYKAQILSWQFFHKAQILIWQLSLHYFYKSLNVNLTSILQSLKPF